MSNHHTRATMNVTPDQVRTMLRKMLPEFNLRFDDERVDEGSLFLSEDDLIPLQEEGDDPTDVLDRLDRKHGDRR